MEESELIDPSAFRSLPQIDPLSDPLYDPAHFPQIPADFSSDLIIDDLDLDLDLDLDFDFEELLQTPNHENVSLLPSSDSPPTADSGDGSGVFLSSPAAYDPSSPHSGNSVSNSPESGNPSGLGLKRKKQDENPNSNSNSNSDCVVDDEEDVKRRARLMRNRESAQLSRQRKKHYVGELEDKVKSMHSTIAELNGRLSFVMAENASLKHQLAGNRGTPPPPAGQLPPLHFPWVPGYAYRPQGAPLVPIPRLKPHKPAAAPPKGKRSKKIASVSLLGFLLALMVFGAVIPGLNHGGSEDVQDGVAGRSKGRILTADGRRVRGLNSSKEIGLDPGGIEGRGSVLPSSGSSQNSSESLPALLYVPRNGKHVKINGNLIIHSVLASERALGEKASRERANQSSVKETGLAIAGTVAPTLGVSQSGKNMGRHSKSFRGSYGDAYDETLKSTPVEGPLQQWFLEGMAGPILKSGMCTEVFQFDTSQSSADPNGIVPAATIANDTTSNLTSKSGRLRPVRNRRILYTQHPIPLPGSALNDTQHIQKPPEGSGSFPGGKKTVPSMVVSVMADPRESGDGEGEGVMPKSLSKVFVVVLLDSVKYVTYSCVLPFKSSTPHLVN